MLEVADEICETTGQLDCCAYLNQTSMDIRVENVRMRAVRVILRSFQELDCRVKIYCVTVPIVAIPHHTMNFGRKIKLNTSNRSQ